MWKERGNIRYKNSECHFIYYQNGLSMANAAKRYLGSGYYYFR